MNGTETRILVIEDEAPIRRFLRISLESQGYRVAEARRADDGIALMADWSPHLVILDLGLPDLDGQELIRRLREWSAVPILVLSVRADEDEKVRALDAGANDYLTKPAGIQELMARVRVLLRQREPAGAEPAVYFRDRLRVDLARREVTIDGSPVYLTRKEYELMRLLVRSAGRVLTHTTLLRALWGPAHASETHYLRVLVSGLRQKLGDDPADPLYIVTEQGVGYRLLD